MRLPWWLWERRTESVQKGQTVTTADGWVMALTEEADAGGNVHQLIKAQRGDEVKRFSPNCTDAEIKAILETGA